MTAAWLFPLMPDPAVRTGTGGFHWYCGGSHETTHAIRPGLDLQSDGAYVLAPPSLHPNGTEYERLNAGLCELPAEILSELESRARTELERSRQRRGAAGGDAAGDRMTLREVLGLLEGVRETHRGWLARCPAHNDQNPSLGVGVGDGGQVLLVCYARRCRFVDIIMALRDRQIERAFRDCPPVTGETLATLGFRTSTGARSDQ